MIAKTAVLNALSDTELTYNDLVSTAKEFIASKVKPADDIICELSKVNTLTNDEIRAYILRLQLASYNLGEIKELALFKADLAEALQKEAYSISFNKTEGAVAAKDKAATLDTAGQSLAASMYNLASSLLKTKLDEVHRVVSSLTSILMSRLSEAKLMTPPQTADIPNTIDDTNKEKQILLED